MAVLNLTEARIRDLPLGSGIWRDTQVKGLMVVCHASTRTYSVQGDVRRNGRHVRTVRTKIDRCDRIGLREARRRAMELMSQIQSGVDPTAREGDTGITLAGALDAHLGDRALSETTRESYRYHLDKYLSRLRGRAVVDISRVEVRDLYEQLRARSGQTTAAGAMRVLRALIATAMRIDETIKANPVSAVRLPSTPRRSVDPLDLAAWRAATDVLEPPRRDLHRAFLLTGARRASLLRVRRDDVDFERRVLTFRHMKTGGQMLFPMGERLTATLRRRLEDDEPLVSEWLWPSETSASGHVAEPRDQGRALPSPHAYRHLARTFLIAAGVPYAEGALLLGQRLPGASGGYVHPEHLVEHLRPFAQRLEDLVVGA